MDPASLQNRYITRTLVAFHKNYPGQIGRTINSLILDIDGIYIEILMLPDIFESHYVFDSKDKYRIYNNSELLWVGIRSMNYEFIRMPFSLLEDDLGYNHVHDYCQSLDFLPKDTEDCYSIFHGGDGNVAINIFVEKVGG